MSDDTGRDDKGRWLKGGTSPNPSGRRSRAQELAYLQIMQDTVKRADWVAIIEKAVEQAKQGRTAAREWLGKYLMGLPTQRTELTGSQGDPLKITVEWEDHATSGDQG